mmetsp:Transcript_26472/g.30379  ORF Transcript_26472/g.30379 Transcript_26472/m.30379 type:complete len:183 (+) Transcript_26472:125-673(+)
MKSLFTFAILPLAYYLPWWQTLIYCSLILLHSAVEPWILVWFYKRQGVPLLPKSALDTDFSWMIRFQKTIAEQYDRFFTLIYGPLCFLMVMDPKILKQILQTKEDLFPKDEMWVKLLRALVGDGLVTSEGQLWKSERRVANKAFSHEKLLKMSGIIEEACNTRIKTWAREIKDKKDGKHQIK